VAQRSPHNPRYQKDAKVGKTRKSAASAKPKREAGERSKSGGDKPDKKRRIEVITNDEIKALRRRYWFFMVVALASATLLLIPAVQEQRSLVSLAFGAWGASFFTALYIEWFKIRKLRKEEIARRKKESKGS
jgi:hypothetical protein